MGCKMEPIIIIYIITLSLFFIISMLSIFLIKTLSKKIIINATLTLPNILTLIINHFIGNKDFTLYGTVLSFFVFLIIGLILFGLWLKRHMEKNMDFSYIDIQKNQLKEKEENQDKVTTK
mgnify:CR=1 FL=1